jgi:uncharacterized Fe-S cluster-containing radical SAM superfamily protein
MGPDRGSNVWSFLMPVDTEALARKYRDATLDTANRRILITNFRGTEQELDLSEPSNCGGFGRIRHFRRASNPKWPSNPLPIDPAQMALGLDRRDEIRAQVFQNAACNWRCWYCFVPFHLLSASPAHSSWLSVSELFQLFAKEVNRPPVLDLSGGQPELVPEWVAWMIEEIDRSELRGKVYLWSDDNLSCDYFWRYLSEKHQELIASYPFYGRVVCLKGFDGESFAFNTNAEKVWFNRQFELLDRLIQSGMNLYAYATFTAPTADNIEDGMRHFVDRLQEIDENLPLRTVPLEIQEFTPVASRITDTQRVALRHQWRAIEVWRREISDRFTSEMTELPITEVRIGKSTVI